MMNQGSLGHKLLLLICLLGLMNVSGCGSAELRAIEAKPESSYESELDKLKKIIRFNVYASGRMPGKRLGLATVYMKVIFQKDSTLDPSDERYIKYQPWWNAKEGLWGFTGVAQRVYENLSNTVETRYGRVYGVNQNMFDRTGKPFRRVKYPVKVPTGGLEKKEGFAKSLDLADVSSYSYGAFHANEGRSIAQASLDKEDAIFFPYFNIFLNKDLAEVSKLDGELVINYKAFVNGYFMLCNHDKCEQATLPKGQHLTITVPLPPKKPLANLKKQEAINLYAQKYLAQIMTDFAIKALDEMKIESKVN